MSDISIEEKGNKNIAKAMVLISWFFGVGWSIQGLQLTINENIIGGILIILAGLVVMPYTREKLNKWIKIKNGTLNINNAKAFSFAITCFVINVAFFNDVISENKAQSELNKDSAKPYKLVAENDMSFAGRKRIEWVIVAPDATTKESRAATVKAAAIELQQSQNTDVSYIFLEYSQSTAGQGNAFAIANYYPDGCGNSGSQCNGVNWEVEASEYVPTELELKVWELWTISRDNFAGDDGVLGLDEEQQLITAIAERLQVSKEQVSLPYITRQKI